jgi:hypothetical protein
LLYNILRPIPFLDSILITIRIEIIITK